MPSFTHWAVQVLRGTQVQRWGDLYLINRDLPKLAPLKKHKNGQQVGKIKKCVFRWGVLQTENSGKP